MKSEALRFDRVTFIRDGIRCLDHFSLRLQEGEILGVLGLNYHGFEEFLELLQQNLPIHYGFVYINEKLVNSYESSDLHYNRISIIDTTSRLVGGLSVAENIFVIRHGFRKLLINRSRLEQQVELLSRDTGISIDGSRYVDELSFFDRCVAALLKAYVNGSRVVVVRNLGDLLSVGELTRFCELMRRLAKTGMSFLYVSNHHEDILSVCERMAVFENGKIIRYIERGDDTESIIRVVSYSFWSRVRHQEHNLSEQRAEAIPDKIPVLSFRHVSCDSFSDLSFSINDGESTVLLGLGAMSVREMAQLFTGTQKPSAGQILLDGQPLSTHNLISVIDENPAETMIFSGLNAMENLCFYLDEKGGSVRRNRRLKHSIRQEFNQVFGEQLDEQDVTRLPTKTRIDLVYRRILLRHPRLVVCIQPFSKADLNLRRHILSLINLLRSRNIPVLILAVSKSDSLHVADRLLEWENGKIVTDRRRSEFDPVDDGDQIDSRV